MSHGELTVAPSWCRKAERAARLVLERAGRPELGGTLRIRTNIPLGCGCGSTTADVTATIRAVGKAVGLRLTSEQVQRQDWEAEGAADPPASGRAVVYGSRTGQIVRRLHRPLPAMSCLGFNTRPGVIVLTEELASRTEYSLKEEVAFREVLGQASAAIEAGRLIPPARLNQSRLPTHRFDELIRLILKAGAAGLAVSHSGTVGAALFDPEIPDLGSRVADLGTALGSLGYDNISAFSVTR